MKTSAIRRPSGTALVTGAASGIGLRLARMLGRRGDPVIALDQHWTQESKDRLIAGSAPDAVVFAEADVCDVQSLRDALAQGVDELGPLTLAINCAGAQDAKPFDEQPGDVFERIVAVDLFGSRNVAEAALGQFGPGGHLVLFGSMAGLAPNYGYTAYCAAKYGVVGLAHVLYLEQHPKGIDVSVVCPPEVTTPMVAEERRSMLEATRIMKETAGTLDIDTAASAIMSGIDARRFLIIPSLRARATRVLTKLLPTPLFNITANRMVDKGLRMQR